MLYGLQDQEDGYLTQHCQQSPFTYLLAGKLGNGKQRKGMIFVVDTRTSNNKAAQSYTGKFIEYYESARQFLAILPNKHCLFWIY